MGLVDDPPESGAETGVGAVEVGDVVDQRGQQRLFDALVDEDVVGRHTRLAHVQELPPHEPASGDLDVELNGRRWPGSCRRARG